LTLFLKEAGLPSDTGNAEGLTIDKLLAEKNLYDLSINFEKTSIEDEIDKWKVPGQSFNTTIKLQKVINSDST
jgi:hypothetical protein